MPGLFGTAFAVSDVRVSWAGGERTLDCLQKVYPLHWNLAGGFAGSVELGFAMLGDLYETLRGWPERAYPVPRALILAWHRRARFLFDHARDDLRELGCELMLIGASPSGHRGAPGWGRTDVGVMRAPRFEPEFAKPDKCLSIGSGSSVAHCKGVLEADTWPLLKMEVGNLGGTGFALASRLWFTLQRDPVDSVSNHLLLARVSRSAGVQIEPVGWHEVDAEPEPWPTIASDWEQFQRLAAEHGLSAAAAVG